MFALVLVMGGFYVIGKSNSAAPALATAGAAVPAPANDAPVPTDRSSKLLDAMKDELFHLELDRQQGKISAEEYAKAKAALDETIKRALARKELASPLGRSAVSSVRARCPSIQRSEVSRTATPGVESAVAARRDGSSVIF